MKWWEQVDATRTDFDIISKFLLQLIIIVMDCNNYIQTSFKMAILRENNTLFIYNIVEV